MAIAELILRARQPNLTAFSVLEARLALHWHPAIDYRADGKTKARLASYH